MRSLIAAALLLSASGPAFAGKCDSGQVINALGKGHFAINGVELRRAKYPSGVWLGSNYYENFKAHTDGKRFFAIRTVPAGASGTAILVYLLQIEHAYPNQTWVCDPS